ncbi:MAG TPA: hypothetical protein VFD82_15065 [Planctomycetota bacterium]|nr:hypothetical protein [Planctomycetota bacterium]
MNQADREDEVGARLTRDAEAFCGMPSAGARAALLASLASLPPRRRRAPRLLLSLAAACTIAGFATWPHGDAAGPRAEPSRADTWRLPLAGTADRALMPLQVELAGLTHDAEALARGIWGQVPAPLRHLVR